MSAHEEFSIIPKVYEGWRLLCAHYQQKTLGSNVDFTLSKIAAPGESDTSWLCVHLHPSALENQRKGCRCELQSGLWLTLEIFLKKRMSQRDWALVWAISSELLYLCFFIPFLYPFSPQKYFPFIPLFSNISFPAYFNVPKTFYLFVSIIHPKSSVAPRLRGWKIILCPMKFMWS